MKQLPLVLSLVLAIGLSACSKKDAETNETAEKTPPPAAEAKPAPKPAAGSTPLPSTPPPPAADSSLPQAPRPQLEPVVRVRPEYPRELAQRYIEGEVVLDFRVDGQGNVVEPEIITSTRQEFAQAALDAVTQWKFQQPENGQPITRRMQQRMPFVIQRPEPNQYFSSDAFPMLLHMPRPLPPEKGLSGRAVARLSLDKTALVRNVVIEEMSGTVDVGNIQTVLKEWRFMPFARDGAYQAVDIKAEIVFTPHQTVLVQYPYPAPELPPAASASQP